MFLSVGAIGLHLVQANQLVEYYFDKLFILRITDEFQVTQLRQCMKLSTNSVK